MITVQHNQSLLDIAIQYYGNAQAAVLLAIVNGIAVSYVPVAGEQLEELDQVYELAIYQELKTTANDQESLITVQHNQSMLDLAIQYAGSAQAAVFLALENKRSISDDVEVSLQLQQDRLPIFSRSILENFYRYSVVVATGSTKISANNIHTNFLLSDLGEILTDQNGNRLTYI
jgi:cytochrome c551/c552